jgi:arginine/lysine/histidine transporter system substrate-binding protein
VAVPWAQLLDTIGQNSTDLLIASISKREERKQQFGIDFSDTYYCATQSLIFRTGAPTGSIHDMVAGKTVGVQNHTTVEKLAEDMAQGGLFHVKPFETPESLVNELITFKIDFGLIDTPFALVAQLEARVDGRDRLSLKEFKSSDFPPAIPKEEQTEEYAIAVRQGETELLNLINNVIAGAKEDGSLALLLHQALQDYVSRSGSAPDSNNTAARSNPWDCSR